MNGWYDSLSSPPLTPPSWVFVPVWTVLYLMIGLGIFFWARRRQDHFLPGRTWGLIALHLAANFAWTPLFFGLQNPLVALIDIALIWLTLCLLLTRFRRECRRAYAFWLPYFFWVTFASYLNAGFWWLNR